MEPVVRNVKGHSSEERRVYEDALGQCLRDDQQVILQVVSFPQPLLNPADNTLPAWCNVYEGLSDEEIADLEKVVLDRADLSRSSY